MFRRVKSQLVSLQIPKQTNDLLQVLMECLHRGLFLFSAISPPLHPSETCLTA